MFRLNGVFAIYKPKGMTSFDVIRKIKNIFKNKCKVGHGGTLDRDAEGVLVVGVGSGTKRMGDYMKSDKKYIGIGKFGEETDTLDSSGTVIKRKLFEHITEDMLLDVVYDMLGSSEQIPPIYSALKRYGVRVSDLARRGVEVKLEPRKITIYDVELLEVNIPNFTIELSVSGGTYIRSIIRDIGHKLNSCAHMVSLKRIKQGDFALDDVVYVEDLSYSTVKYALI